MVKKQWIQHPTNTQSHETAKTKDKPTATAYIPYTQTTYGRLSRMLTKHTIKKSIPPPLKKISATTSHLSRMPWD
jgi:hypothetical protein